jgi:hypothetical protein
MKSLLLFFELATFPWLCWVRLSFDYVAYKHVHICQSFNVYFLYISCVSSAYGSSSNSIMPIYRVVDFLSSSSSANRHLFSSCVVCALHDSLFFRKINSPIKCSPSLHGKREAVRDDESCEIRIQYMSKTIQGRTRIGAEHTFIRPYPPSRPIIYIYTHIQHFPPSLIH